MKNSLKSKRIYLFAAIMTVIGIGLPFLILVITLNIDTASPFQYPALLGAFAAAYLLIGYIWGDLHSVAYRRKNKNWDGELPEDIKTESWKRRWPFFLAALAVLVAFLVVEIIYWSTGHYPFL